MLMTINSLKYVFDNIKLCNNMILIKYGYFSSNICKKVIINSFFIEKIHWDKNGKTNTWFGMMHYTKIMFYIVNYLNEQVSILNIKIKSNYKYFSKAFRLLTSTVARGHQKHVHPNLFL